MTEIICMVLGVVAAIAIWGVIYSVKNMMELDELKKEIEKLQKDI